MRGEQMFEERLAEIKVRANEAALPLYTIVDDWIDEDGIQHFDPIAVLDNNDNVVYYASETTEEWDTVCRILEL